MKNLSKKQLGIENAVNELNEMISLISEIISRADEIVSQFRERTSEVEVIKPAILSLPDSSVEVGQARVIDKETIWGKSEPKQSNRTPFIN